MTTRGYDNAVFFVTDEKFLAVTMANALVLTRQASRRFDIHVFYEGVLEPEIEPVEGVTLHRNRLIGNLPDWLPQTDRWPLIVYCRFFAPFLKDFRYDKLLYLDADTACHQDIEPLFGLPMEQAAVAATHDFGVILPTFPGLAISSDEWLRSIGINNNRYFNAGVMLINCEEWREVDFELGITEFFREFNDYTRIPDQDCLNNILQDKWIELSPKWNFQTPFFAHDLEQYIDPVIFHYSEVTEPWEDLNFPYGSKHSEYFSRAMKKLAIPRHGAKTLYDRYNRKVRKIIMSIIHHSWIGKHRLNKKVDIWKKNHEFYNKHMESSLKNQLYTDITSGISPTFSIPSGNFSGKLVYRDGVMRAKSAP